MSETRPLVWPAGDAFSAHRISSLCHRLGEHPLLRLDALRALAQELNPVGGCRIIDPSATQSSVFRHKPASRSGDTLDGVFGRIASPGSWIALYNVERVARYSALLDEAVSAVRLPIEREQPGIHLVSGFVFVSTAPSVTPFHIDRENNLWLQVRGRKTMGVWDRTLMPTRAVEEFFVDGNDRGIRLTEELLASCSSRDVGPGEGIYLPSTTPHMTRTAVPSADDAGADPVSVSIGITFYTSVTRRHALAHQFNHLARRIGLDPVAPGRSVWRDRLKAPLGRAVLRVMEWRRDDLVVPPGMQ